MGGSLELRPCLNEFLYALEKQGTIELKRRGMVPDDRLSTFKHTLKADDPLA